MRRWEWWEQEAERNMSKDRILWLLVGMNVVALVAWAVWG